MSVLVACRGPNASLPDVELIPLRMLPRSDAYLQALSLWGADDVEGWSAAVSWQGRTWDDLVNDAVADEGARALLVQALGDVARACTEIGVWYAGFPDEIPTASTPEGFEALLDDALAAGELEPAARMIAGS